MPKYSLLGKGMTQIEFAEASKQDLQKLDFHSLTDLCCKGIAAHGSTYGAPYVDGAQRIQDALRKVMNEIRARLGLSLLPAGSLERRSQTEFNKEFQRLIKRSKEVYGFTNEELVSLVCQGGALVGCFWGSADNLVPLQKKIDEMSRELRGRLLYGK